MKTLNKKQTFVVCFLSVAIMLLVFPYVMEFIRIFAVWYENYFNGIVRNK